MIAILLIVSVVIGVLVLVGYALSSNKVEEKSTVYDISQKKLFEIVTNNEDYSYRSGVKEIILLKKEGNIQTWKEIGKHGGELLFRTTKYIPYSCYEFDILKGLGFHGHWKGFFKKMEENKTEFTAIQSIVIPNPFIRLMSRVFVDMGELMENYQLDLMKKVYEINQREEK